MAYNISMIISLFEKSQVYFVLLFLFSFVLLSYLINAWLCLLQRLNRLPCLKLKFYQFLGHATILFNHRLKTIGNVSPHVRDFEVMCGYHHLFAREGLSTTWFFFHEVTIFKADAVELILNNSKEIKKAWLYKAFEPWLGTGVLTSYDEKWKNRRKLLTPSLHFKILKEYLPIMNKQGRILTDVLKTATQEEFINISPVLARSSFNIISECILDKESQADPENLYLNKVHELTSSISERIHKPLHWHDFPFYLSTAGKAFAKAVEIAQDLTKKIISEKIKEKQEFILREIDKDADVSKYSQAQLQKSALVDLLVDEHLRHNSLSENDIRQEVDAFVFAGHDTTSVTMSWCLWMIGLHPWIQDKIHEELDTIFGDDDREATLEDLKNMKYLECVIKETMRLYPSVPVIARDVRNDIRYGEYTIPKGCMCVVYAHVLHRDPDVFPDPERFDPERFTPENSAGRHPFAYVPFSAGPRNCLGHRFALMEIKILLSSVLQRYKLRSLDPRDKVHILSELVLRPANDLRIQVRRRDQNFDFYSVYYRP